MRTHHFGVQNDAFAPQKNFFRNGNIILMYILAPFIVKQILRVDPEIWYVILGQKNDPIATKQTVFGKTIDIISMNLLAPFIVQNLKKKYWVDPELRWSIIFGPKMAHFHQIRIFFTEIVNIIFMNLLAPFIVQNF